MIKEPTPIECNMNTPVFKDGKEVGFATWYPQMGGYIARCIVLTEADNNNCFDCLIWHDGEFPFTEGDRNPNVVHHCDADQFIDFGKLVLKYQGEE